MPLRTISALFQRDRAVYYYSAAVILAAKCLHGKNNVPSAASVARGGCLSPPSLGNDLRGCCMDTRMCVYVCVCVVRFVCIRRELDRNKRKRKQNKGLNMSGGVTVKRCSRCGFTHHQSGISRGTLLNTALLLFSQYFWLSWLPSCPSESARPTGEGRPRQ